MEGREATLAGMPEMGKRVPDSYRGCPGADQEGPNQPDKSLGFIFSAINSVKKFRKESGGIQFTFKKTAV